MLRLRRCFAMLFLVALMLPGQARAATFFGEFWDASTRVRNLTEAFAIMSASGPTSTFQSTGIDYPQGSTTRTGSGSTTLAQFLGTDAASIIGPSAMNIAQSVYRFTGFVDFAAGINAITVASDDGFRLSVGGSIVAEHPGSRGYQPTTLNVDVGSGKLPIELIFFENQGQTGVTFLVDGIVASPIDPAPSTVPLPGALGLLGLGVAALGFRRFRSKAQA